LGCLLFSFSLHVAPYYFWHNPHPVLLLIPLVVHIFGGWHVVAGGKLMPCFLIVMEW
jgi:hypothetical protein